MVTTHYSPLRPELPPYTEALHLSLRELRVLAQSYEFASATELRRLTTKKEVIALMYAPTKGRKRPLNEPTEALLQTLQDLQVGIAELGRQHQTSHPLRLLTPDEVCALLQCTKDWLYDVTQNGTFPCVKLGRQLRFRPAEVEAYLDGAWEVLPADTTTTKPAARKRRTS